jgi:hypothetical protein
MATPVNQAQGSIGSIEAMVRAKLSADYPTRRFRERQGPARLLAAWRLHLVTMIRRLIHR